MKVSFLILTGKHQGKTLTLPADVVIVGRDPQAHIRVNSTEVSRHHCEIHVRGTDVIVKDLGSRNGTFINGEAIFGEVPIHPGDTLHVGSMVFELAGKKKPVPQNTPGVRKPPGARAAAKAPSEDELIDWLAEDEPTLDADTTIISNADASKMGLGEKPNGDDHTSLESPVLVPRSTSINVKPIEENSPSGEAADIIKKYWANKS
ncbi:MAG TPA: hypothetical protein DD473_17855 [Planctomycetaceae bacterium]|nr:hypothetical protein [Planctomycetaceae bacterium]